MVQASKLPLLSAIPTIVWGFASTVGTIVATGRPIATRGLDNLAIVAGTALILGGIFGYLSEIWGDSLCVQGKPFESKSAAGESAS
jgi:Protein of unknown function (DUF1097)